MFQIISDFSELCEGGLEAFHDLCGNNIRIREIGTVFEAFIVEPKKVVI